MTNVNEYTRFPMTNEQTEAREALAGFDLHMQAGVPSHVILGEYESEQIVASMRERGWRPPFPAPSEDEREALTYLITAFRFRERGLRGTPMEPDLAVARPLAEHLIAEGFTRASRPTPPEDVAVVTDEMVEAAAEGIARERLGRHLEDLDAYWDARPEAKVLDIDACRPSARAALTAALAARPLPETEETTVTIPKPVVPFGPANLTEDEGTAHYLREVDRKIGTGHITVGGSNVTATVRRLLIDTATALAPLPESEGQG